MEETYTERRIRQYKERSSEFQVRSDLRNGIDAQSKSEEGET